ncbi:hypothetical protein, partial [Mycobacterium sp. 2YAF39]|uniref:hypothetical protein n=1 Tax=Mycobacterium sp. 2YAF39 TaxID=3233033 RepID=UPI003F95AD2D
MRRFFIFGSLAQKKMVRCARVRGHVAGMAGRPACLVARWRPVRRAGSWPLAAVMWWSGRDPEPWRCAEAQGLASLCGACMRLLWCMAIPPFLVPVVTASG